LVSRRWFLLHVSEHHRCSSETTKVFREMAPRCNVSQFTIPHETLPRYQSCQQIRDTRQPLSYHHSMGILDLWTLIRMLIVCLIRGQRCTKAPRTHPHLRMYHQAAAEHLIENTPTRTCYAFQVETRARPHDCDHCARNYRNRRYAMISRRSLPTFARLGGVSY
jgi:hypothetical protein